MRAQCVTFLAAAAGLGLLVSRSATGGAEATPAAEPGECRSAHFGVYWPPQDPAAAGTKSRALLEGVAALRAQRLPATGWTASIRITLRRPADETGWEFWNARLAFPEYDWMSYVRVWDADRRWLWPNLACLLRLHGKERVERYGGVDPGKGVDNDFAAVLIRKYDADGQSESDATRENPLVSAEWHALGAAGADKQTVVHAAQSDESTLHLGAPGGPSRGCAGIWVIYADFLGAKPPPSWPPEPEYAGGILAYFEARWDLENDARPELRIEQRVPRRATGFDWERWTLRTLASPDTKSTGKLTELGSPGRSAGVVRP